MPGRCPDASRGTRSTCPREKQHVSWPQTLRNITLSSPSFFSSSSHSDSDFFLPPLRKKKDIFKLGPKSLPKCLARAVFLLLLIYWQYLTNCFNFLIRSPWWYIRLWVIRSTGEKFRDKMSQLSFLQFERVYYFLDLSFLCRYDHTQKHTANTRI